MEKKVSLNLIFEVNLVEIRPHLLQFFWIFSMISDHFGFEEGRRSNFLLLRVSSVSRIAKKWFLFWQSDEALILNSWKIAWHQQNKKWHLNIIRVENFIAFFWSQKSCCFCFRCIINFFDSWFEIGQKILFENTWSISKVASILSPFVFYLHWVLLKRWWWSDCGRCLKLNHGHGETWMKWMKWMKILSPRTAVWMKWKRAQTKKMIRKWSILKRLEKIFGRKEITCRQNF